MKTCPDCQGWSSDESGLTPCARCDDTGAIEDDAGDVDGGWEESTLEQAAAQERAREGESANARFDRIEARLCHLEALMRRDVRRIG